MRQATSRTSRRSVPFADYDPGPPPPFAQLLMGGDPAFPWPTFPDLGVTAHRSFGYGPIYRGRFTSVRLLILADQESQDDLFTFRALTGDGGQRLQAWLTAAGLTRSYLILRSLPVDTLGLSDATREALIDHDFVRALHREAVRRVASANPLAAIVSVGSLSKRLLPHVAPAGLPPLEMAAPSQPGFLASWREALDAFRSLSFPRDVPSPSFSYRGERGQIPRYDLPFGTLRWQGSSSDRGARATHPASAAQHYYKIYMPKWAFQRDPQ